MTRTPEDIAILEKRLVELERKLGFSTKRRRLRQNLEIPQEILDALPELESTHPFDVEPKKIYFAEVIVEEPIVIGEDIAGYDDVQEEEFDIERSFDRYFEDFTQEEVEKLMRSVVGNHVEIATDPIPYSPYPEDDFLFG